MGKKSSHIREVLAWEYIRGFLVLFSTYHTHISRGLSGLHQTPETFAHAAQSESVSGGVGSTTMRPMGMSGGSVSSFLSAEERMHLAMLYALQSLYDTLSSFKRHELVT